MRLRLLLLACFLLPALRASSFCGFYVAKAGAKLYNKASQVILARDGDRTVVTMSNDFSGDVKDFALVVPVPEVLKREQIRVLQQDIFKKLDDYSAPRLVEYHDEDPCSETVYMVDGMSLIRESAVMRMGGTGQRKRKVKVEAEYDIEEYKIVLLSAKDSGDLVEWLTENGYNIPAGASEVLEPYIKNKLKFFVVKVNLDVYQAGQYTALRPLQITYKYDKFMLPIRLGMANANGPQDLTIYAYSRQGRIECANYPTVDVPTNKNIPVSVKDGFGEFYKAVFEKAWRSAGRNAVMLEYGWDISSNNYLKCDPCPSQPPLFADLEQSGVFWLEHRNSGGSDYVGDVYVTRLHVRYDRDHFPEDLLFLQTPNKANFQARYIITHPAVGDMSCDEGRDYLKMLAARTKLEDDNLAELTGATASDEDRDATPFIFIDNYFTNGPALPYIVVAGVFGLWFMLQAWRRRRRLAA